MGNLVEPKKKWSLQPEIPKYSSISDVTHTSQCINTRGDISNTEDAGISLERSAAAGEGQRELSCQSCMQQAVQYHITATNPMTHSLLSTGH